MAKSTKKKFLSFLNLLILFVLFCCLSGCGNKGDEIIKPTGSGRQIALSGSPTSLAAGQNSILTATVTNSSGTAVSGATVAFSFVTNNSGGTLVRLNGGATDAGGKAMAIYTAGATGSSTVEDMIQASATGSTGVVTITRTAGTGTGTDSISSLRASLSTVNGGQMSVITAGVNSGAANGEVSNQTITFTIPVNNSGASFIDSGGASVSSITIPMQLGGLDSPNISATYKAGTNVSGTEVEDMVKATLGNGSTSSIIITRTGSVGGTGVRMTVSATPNSLVAGAISVIVAQVYNPDSTPAPGLAVTFAFVTNNSGAPALTVVNGTTDASGTATATYTAGNNSPSLSIQDAVSATVTGATGNSAGAAIITRLPTVGTGSRIISFTQTPASDKDNRIGPPPTVSYIKMLAKVTTDNLTTPVKNKEVTFSIIAGDGTITTPDGTTTVGIGNNLTVNTDDNGEAYIHFNIPAAGLGDTIIRAQIEGTTNGGDASSIVYWKGIIPTLTLAANPSSVVAGGASTITATVTDGSGNAIINLPVTFTLATGGSGGSLSTYSGITDASGKAVTVLRAGTTAPAMDSVSASASYLGFGTSDAVSISVTVPTP